MVGEIYKTNRIKCSDGYPGGILHICNLSEHKKGFLYESFGVLEYDNEKFNFKIKDFVNDELKLVFYRNSVIEYDSMIKYDNNCKWYKHYELDIDLGWVDKLEIFAARGNEAESFVLSDICTDNGKVAFPVYYNGEWKPSYEWRGNRVKYFSIVVIYNRVADVNDLIGIVKHEIRHGYDLFRDKFIANHSNRDIIYFNDILNKLKTTENKDVSYRYFETRYWEYPKEDMRCFISRLNVLDLFKLFCDMVYYFNVSEIGARLNNYKEELENCACNNKSSTFKLYSGLRQLVGVIKMCVSDENKRIFSENYINMFETGYQYDENDIEDRLKDKMKKNKFYISFKHEGKYDIESFNKICDFYIERINKYFFKNADKIYSDIKTR